MSNILRNQHEYEEVRPELASRKFIVLYGAADVASIPKIAQTRAALHPVSEAPVFHEIDQNELAILAQKAEDAARELEQSQGTAQEAPLRDNVVAFPQRTELSSQPVADNDLDQDAIHKGLVEIYDEQERAA